MITLGDVLKLLDQVPVWKTLKALPDRVEALEKANAELTARLDAMTAAPKKALGQTCKACGEPAVRRTSSVVSKGPFGRLGAMDEVWTCGECGEKDVRLGVRS